MDNLEGLVHNNCSQIVAIQDEIKKLELNIEELNDKPEESTPVDVVEPPSIVPVGSTVAPIRTPEIDEIIEEVEIEADIIAEDDRCPSCNGEINPVSKFCRHCGSSV